MHADIRRKIKGFVFSGSTVVHGFKCIRYQTDEKRDFAEGLPGL